MGRNVTEVQEGNGRPSLYWIGLFGKGVAGEVGRGLKGKGIVRFVVAGDTRLDE